MIQHLVEASIIGQNRKIICLTFSSWCTIFLVLYQFELTKMPQWYNM
uniref:Uncharacterized protein n=1 Tax=Rhizophora mucronata TaxID=61149 RepID=A0A2P2J4Z9_RHIMU